VSDHNEWAIHTDHLTKTFGPHAAVDRLSLQVPRGSVFGFLGPNGSGKTTTIRMLLGLASATAGTISLLGHPIPGEQELALPKVGALVEGPAFYPYLSGRKNLLRMDAADRFSDATTRALRVQSALTRVGLTNAAEKKAGNYSLGMKQRLGLANALLKPRELLILDEPTNGLDPQGTREVRNLIRSLADEGITIFLSSHLLSEIEQLSSHVAVMSQGRLVANGSLDQLRSNANTRIVVDVDDPDRAIPILTGQGLGPLTRHETTLTAPVAPDCDARAITRALVAGGVGVRAIQVERPSLEEYFVTLTGEGFEVAR
jgi:ABC-type multidrug transport system ATPase subunit